MAAVWFILTVPTGAYQKSRFRNVSSVKCDESSVNKAACQLHPLNIEATPSSSGKITPDSAAGLFLFLLKSPYESYSCVVTVFFFLAMNRTWSRNQP